MGAFWRYCHMHSIALNRKDSDKKLPSIEGNFFIYLITPNLIFTASFIRLYTSYSYLIAELTFAFAYGLRNGNRLTEN